MLWHGMLLFAILDAISLALTITVAQPADFRRMKWPIVGLAGLVWAAIWLWAIGNFWQDVYRYVFPAWSRLWIPWAQALLSAAVAGLLWWLVQRLPASPVLAFCLLGGIWGGLTHAWAVVRGLIDKPPVLQGANPWATILFAGFEFVLYWSLVLLAAAGLQQFMDRILRRPMSNRSPGK